MSMMGLAAVSGTDVPPKCCTSRSRGPGARDSSSASDVYQLRHRGSYATTLIRSSISFGISVASGMAVRACDFKLSTKELGTLMRESSTSFSASVNCRVRAEGVAGGRWRLSKLSFSKASELVRDGAHNPRCCPIIHRFSSETVADRIDGAVCARSRQASLRARTASFVGKPERQFQLHDRMRFEV